MYEIKRYEIIDTIPKIKRLVSRMEKIDEWAYDCETNTLRVYGDNDEFILVGISISWGKYNNYYIPMGHRFDDKQLLPSTVAEYLRPIFARKDVRIITANHKFDAHTLEEVGIYIETDDLFDVVIASWLINENTKNGLKENSQAILGIDQSKFKDVLTTVTGEEKKSVGLKANNKATFDLVRIKNGYKYALDDAYYTWELYLYFMDKLEEEKMDKIFFKMYVPILKAVFNMEKRGVSIDMERLAEIKVGIEKDIEDLTYKIYEFAGIEFNIGSTQQLAELLFGFEDLKVYKNPNKNILDVTFNFPLMGATAKGSPQVTGAILEEMAQLEYKTTRKQEGIEMVKLLVAIKKLNKLNTAFVEGIYKNLYNDNKIHSSFNISGTTSGRFSCSAINLQQLPNSMEDDETGLYELVTKYKIRELFIGSVNDSGKRNKIIAVDYSNLEIKILAHFSKDKELLETFSLGGDVHNATAKKMFELDCDVTEVKKKYPHLRKVSKALNFGLMYGMGARTLYETIKKSGLDLAGEEYLKMYKVNKGEEVAQIYVDKYFETYSGVAQFIRNQKKFAKKNGYVLSLVGRKRRLENITSNDYKMVAYEERLSVNAPIQGSGGDIVMNAQIRLESNERLKELDCYMIVQVHDEAVFECPEENLEEAIEIIQDLMDNPFGKNTKLNVTLTTTAGSGDSYEQAK